MSLPGVRTLDHVGLTVPDLGECVRFLVEVVGFEEVYSHRPGGGDGEIQVRQFGRHPETELEGISMLRLATLNLELLQFRAPDQRRQPPRTSDWGGAHLALYSDDIDAAAAHLRSHGAEVLGEPMALPAREAGPGNRFVYCRVPGGLTLELITYPEGKAYEAGTARRLFDPRGLPVWEQQS